MGNATKEKKSNQDLRTQSYEQMWACVSRCRRTCGRRRPRTPRLCGQSWGPLCQPLNDDSVEQVGFFQGLVLISQLFIGEGGHEDETGGSHRWPSIYYEEPDVTDPVQRDQTQRVTLLLHSLDK